MNATTPRMVLPILGILTLLAASASANWLHGYYIHGAELWLDGPESISLQTGTNPDIAVNSQGEAIAVWEARNVPGGDDREILMRRFDLDGNPLGDPVQVNTLVTAAQQRARIAIASDDSFLVTWESYESITRGATPYFRVKAQAYNATGNPVGAERALGTVPTQENVEVESDVAALTGGGYVVVWHSWLSGGTDDNNRSMQARLVNADGSPNGGQFQCNTVTGGQQHEGAVTWLPGGGFLVVWADAGLVGRRFNAAGQGIGNELPISTTPAFNQRDSDAATNEYGQVAVVWVDDFDGNSIRGRLLNSSTLAPLGAGFRVNDLNDNDQEHPRLAPFGNGFFATFWTYDSAGDDDDLTSIQGRIITGVNLFEGLQFQINEFISGHQTQPAVGSRAGRLAVAFGSGGNETVLGEVITGQRFTFCLFCDDFETGDSMRWSTVFPASP